MQQELQSIFTSIYKKPTFTHIHKSNHHSLLYHLPSASLPPAIHFSFTRHPPSTLHAFMHPGQGLQHLGARPQLLRRRCRTTRMRHRQEPQHRHRLCAQVGAPNSSSVLFRLFFFIYIFFFAFSFPYIFPFLFSFYFSSFSFFFPIFLISFPLFSPSFSLFPPLFYPFSSSLFFVGNLSHIKIPSQIYNFPVKYHSYDHDHTTSKVLQSVVRLWTGVGRCGGGTASALFPCSVPWYGAVVVLSLCVFQFMY